MVHLSYRRHRFPAEIIQHAIWLYLPSRDRSRSTRFPVAVAPDDRNMSALLEVAEPNASARLARNIYAARHRSARLALYPIMHNLNVNEVRRAIRDDATIDLEN